MNQLEKLIKILFAPCDIKDHNESSVLYRHDTFDYSFFIRMPNPRDFINQPGQSANPLWDMELSLNIMTDGKVQNEHLVLSSYLMPEVFPLILNGIESRINDKFQQNHLDYFQLRQYCHALIHTLQQGQSVLDVPEKFKSFKPCKMENLNHETQIVFSSYNTEDNNSNNNNNFKEIKHKLFIPREVQARHFSSMVCELIYDFQGSHSEDYGQHCMSVLIPNLQGQKHQMIQTDSLDEEEHVLHTRLFDYPVVPEYDENQMMVKAQQLYQMLSQVSSLSKEALAIHLEYHLPENEVHERKLKI